MESHTDMIAHEMGIDPYALRLRNVLQDGQVCATGGRYKHVRGEATLRAAVEAANWGAPKSGPYVGRGISLGQRPQGQSVYSVTVSMDEHARATFYTWCRKPAPAPIPSAGKWWRRTGIPVEDVTAVQMDTDGGPTDAGAGGSSVGGTHAALGAAQGVRQQLTFLAAEFYGWPEERIVFHRVACSSRRPGPGCAHPGGGLPSGSRLRCPHLLRHDHRGQGARRHLL